MPSSWHSRGFLPVPSDFRLGSAGTGSTRPIRWRALQAALAPILQSRPHLVNAPEEGRESTSPGKADALAAAGSARWSMSARVGLSQSVVPVDAAASVSVAAWKPVLTACGYPWRLVTGPGSLALRPLDQLDLVAVRIFDEGNHGGAVLHRPGRADDVHAGFSQI